LKSPRRPSQATGHATRAHSLVVWQKLAVPGTGSKVVQLTG
jgi:hypothetical protein